MCCNIYYIYNYIDMYISSNIISYLQYLICRACVVDSLHAVTVLSSRLVQGPAAKAVRQLREKNSEAQLAEASSIQVLSTLLGNLAPQQHSGLMAQGWWTQVLDMSEKMRWYMIIHDIVLSCFFQDCDFTVSSHFHSLRGNMFIKLARLLCKRSSSPASGQWPGEESFWGVRLTPFRCGLGVEKEVMLNSLQYGSKSSKQHLNSGCGRLRDSHRLMIVGKFTTQCIGDCHDCHKHPISEAACWVPNFPPKWCPQGQVACSNLSPGEVSKSETFEQENQQLGSSGCSLHQPTAMGPRSGCSASPNVVEI